MQRHSCKYCIGKAVVAKLCYDLKPKVTQTLADSYMVEKKTHMMKPPLTSGCANVFGTYLLIDIFGTIQDYRNGLSNQKSAIMTSLADVVAPTWQRDRSAMGTLNVTSGRSVLLASVEDEQLRLWIRSDGQLCSFHPTRVFSELAYLVHVAILHSYRQMVPAGLEVYDIGL